MMNKANSRATVFALFVLLTGSCAASPWKLCSVERQSGATFLRSPPEQALLFRALADSYYERKHMHPSPLNKEYWFGYKNGDFALCRQDPAIKDNCYSDTWRFSQKEKEWQITDARSIICVTGSNR
jgi:hypothetical protein